MYFRPPHYIEKANVQHALPRWARTGGKQGKIVDNNHSIISGLEKQKNTPTDGHTGGLLQYRND